MNSIHHWIDGKVVESTSGRTAPVFNPAIGEQSGEVDLASVDEVDAAVASAKAAFPGWRSASLSRRSEVMFRIRELGRRQSQGDRLAAHRRARQGAVRCDG